MRRARHGLVVLLAAVLVLGGAVEAAKKKPRKRSAPPPAVPQVTPLPVQTAGPAAEVQGIVIPGSALAGVALWPSARSLEGPDLPPGTALMAAHLAADAACAGQPGARPIVALFPAGIGVGASLTMGDASALGAILGRAALPGGTASAVRLEDLERLQARAADYWADPLLVSRRAALGLLFPVRAVPSDEFPGPPAIADAAPEQIDALLARVRGRAPRYLVAGPEGTTDKVAAAVPTGPAGSRAADAPVPAAPLPASAIVALEDEEEEIDSVGLTIAFRTAGLDRRLLESALPVLAEALKEGQGSLAQRLQVVLGAPAPARVEILPGEGGEGAFVLSTLVPRESASVAWRVLSGSISSVQTISLREDALYKARFRLAQEALQRRSDPTVALLERFGAMTPALGVPAETVKASDLLEAAKQALTPERRACAAAGPVDEETAAAPEFDTAMRIEWERFDPDAEAMMRPGVGELRAAEAIALAREVLDSLAEAPSAALDPRYSASYKVREETPAGPVETILRVTAGQGAIELTVEGPAWTIEAKEGGAGAEPTPEGVLHLPHTNRLLGLSLREPAVLLATILAGGLPVDASAATCDGAPCPALRTELADGSVLTLAIDPEQKLPRSLQIWWPGKEGGGGPDETVHYLGWRRAGAVRVASEMVVDDSLGTTRRLTLVDWVSR